ncbi:MAG TPA: hypothetical protein PJ982_09460, partial [Lacipirellulaceae bacterium]|nr:hypothetical protein [Lacipirellulaceae bacterium]
TSKYPPGQGLALAAGQALAGEPAAGLWLTSALAAAATYWMLLGWTSTRFACLGAVLWIAHPSFQLAWGQTYWGGTLAYVGGALVFGAAIRMQRRAAVSDALVMGAGAVLLASTRPYEGLAFCLATGGYVSWRWRHNGGPTRRDFALKLAVPLGAVLGLGLAALGVYNHAVTGDLFKFPYGLHQDQYGQSPLFVGGMPGPQREYRHAAFDQFHGTWEMGWYERQATLGGWFDTKVAVTCLAAMFFLSPAMALGVLACRPFRWTRLQPAVAVAAFTYAATLVSVFYNPHYWAPFAPLIVLAAVAGLRRIDVLSRRLLHGVPLAPLLVGLQVVLFGYWFAKHAAAPQSGWPAERAAIVERLEATPERHLVLVKYGPQHNCHAEWVFNGADVDGSKIVWARTMDDVLDAELLDYFADRKAWLLEPEARRMTLISRESHALVQSGGPSASTPAGE